MNQPSKIWPWILPFPLVGALAFLSLALREGGNRIDISLHLPLTLALIFTWGHRALPGTWLAISLLYLAVGYPPITALAIAAAPTLALALVYYLHRWLSKSQSILASSRSMVLWIAIALFVPMLLVYLIMAPFTEYLNLQGNPSSKVTFLNIMGINVGLITAGTPLFILLFQNTPLRHLIWTERIPAPLARAFAIPGNRPLGIALLAAIYGIFPLGFFLIPLEYAIPLTGFAMLTIAIRYGFGHTLVLTTWAILWNIIAARTIHPNHIMAETAYGEFTLAVIIWFVHITGRTFAQLHEETETRLASEDRSLKLAMRHQAVLQALPDVVFRISADGTFLEVHQNGQHALYEKPEHFLGRRISEIMPSPLSRELEDRVAAAATGMSTTFEYDLAVGGDNRRYEARFMPGSEGEAIVVIRDITELHHMRRALSTSEARYRLLFDESPMGVVIMDTSGHVISANRAAANITGYSVEDANKVTRETVAGDAQLLDIARSIRESRGHFAGEYPIRHASGRLVSAFIHTYTVPLPDAAPQVCVLIEDLEGLKRLEHERQKDQELLREAEVTNHMGVFRWEWARPPLPDEKPALCFYSKGAYRLLDLPEDPALAPGAEILSSGLEVGDRTRLSRAIRTALDHGRSDLVVKKPGATGGHRHLAVSFWSQKQTSPETRLNGLIRDITQTQNLHDTLEEYRTLFHLSTEPFVILNLQGQILEVNPALSGITGRPAQSLLQRPLTDLILYPEEREQVDARISESLNLGTFLSGLSVGLAVRGGGSRRMLLNLTPDMAGGKAYAVLTDIQELETARQLVLENQSRFQDLFTRLPAGFALHSMMFGPGGEALDYRFLLVNPHFERLTGLKAEAIIGRTVRQVLPDTETSWIQTYGRVVSTGESITFTQYSQAIDKYFMVHAYRAREGQFATVFFPVTEQVKAEDARRLAEQRLTILMASLDAVVWEADAQGAFTYVSPATLRITGHAPDRWKDPQFHRKQIHPDDAGKWQTAHLVDAKATGNRVLEYRVKHAQGHFIWIRNHIRIAFDDQKVAGLRGVWVDVSDSHAAHSELEERESRFLAVVTSMSEGLVIQDEEGLIVDCNIAAEQVLGLSRDQMSGRTSMDPRWRTIREDGSPFPGNEHPAMVTLATGEPQRDVVMGVHKVDGTLAWILINSHLIADAFRGTKQVVATFRDVTENRIAFRKISEEVERRKRSLERARELQEQLSTRSLPLHPALDMCGVFVPSEEVGGDFMRVRLLSGDRLFVLLADCTGHGVEASMMAVLLSRDCESLLGEVERHGNPALLLAELNRRMRLLDLEGHYPAVLAAVVDLTAGTLTWANAGGEAPILYADGKPEALPRAPGLYLGFDIDTVYENRSRALLPGEVLLFCSDALLELNPEAVGEASRLSPILPKEGPHTAKVFLEGLLDIYRSHRGPAAHDDLSALVLRPVRPWESESLPHLDRQQPACKSFLIQAMAMGWSEAEANGAMDHLCQQMDRGLHPSGPYTLVADGHSMVLKSAQPPPAKSPWIPVGTGSSLPSHRHPPLIQRSL